MTDDTFDLGRTDRIETPVAPRRRRWGALLAVAAGAAVMLAPTHEARAGRHLPTVVTPAAHGTAHKNDAARSTPLQSTVFASDLDQTADNLFAAPDFDLARSAIQRRVQDATVMIAIMGPNWQMRGLGTGTLLADHRIDGHKAIVTALHVGGTRAFEAGTGVHLVVMDHDGDILGVARPLDRRMPTATREAGIDQPVLLGFDAHYRIDAGKLKAIRGVEVAPEVPNGYLFGEVDGRIGVDQGASGGGWYDARGRLIGVTDFVVTHPGTEVALTGQSMSETLLSGAPVSDSINTLTTSIAGRNHVAVQGLGSSNILAQLRTTATVTRAEPRMQADGADYGDATGVGYPLGFPMGWHAGLKQQPKLADSMPYLYDAVEKEFRLESRPPAATFASSSGGAQTAMAIMRSAAGRIRQILVPGASTPETVIAPDEARAMAAPEMGGG